MMTVTIQDDDFKIDAVPRFFLKSDQEKNCYRIGGIATTEDMDREQEVIVQKGLDFSDFLDSGWFNWNHQHAPDTLIGYPELSEYRVNKGWYVEGFLLHGHPPADQVWSLAKSLENTKRRLGMSIEGKIQERQGHMIMKARIKHVAITHVPINTNTTLLTLSKAMFNKNMNTVGAVAMNREQMGSHVSSVLWGDQDGCFDASGSFHGGMRGAVGHLVHCRGFDVGKAREFLSKLIAHPAYQYVVRQAGL